MREPLPTVEGLLEQAQLLVQAAPAPVAVLRPVLVVVEQPCEQRRIAGKAGELALDPLTDACDLGQAGVGRLPGGRDRRALGLLDEHA